MPDNLYCDQTTPWQGVYFFTNTVWNIKCAWQSVLWPNHTLARCVFFLPILFAGKLIHYIHSNFIVLLQHISPWTQSWIQAFIVAYENLTFKSVKQNCCFRNQCWDAVKSSQALKKVESWYQIDQSECNIFGQNISNSNLNWFKVQPFSDWYIYKPVDMPHKWIGSTPK